MKVLQVKAQKKEGTAAGFRAARRGQQSSSAAFNPIALLSRSTEHDGSQAKLKVGSPGDIYEKEADQISEQVMNMPEPVAQRQPVEEEEPIQARPLAEQITPLVQRQPEEEEEPLQEKSLLRRQAEDEEEPVQAKTLVQRQVEEEEEPVQEKSLLQRQNEEEEESLQTKSKPGETPVANPSFESRINSLKGGGQPLPTSTRAFFEPRFGQDFSNVRVHTDSSAAQTAKEVQAKAFTVGNDVVFGSGQYSPGNETGKRLLAHELTHVVQQKSSLSTYSSGGKSRNDAVRPSQSAAPVMQLQRKPQSSTEKLTGMQWRNAVIGAENEIQKRIRSAQRDGKGQLKLEVVVAPDGVSVVGSRATGKAPTGSPEPDGIAIYYAAHRPLKMITISAPSSKLVYSILLKRTGSKWISRIGVSSIRLIGKTLPASAVTPKPTSELGSELANTLQNADSSGVTKAQINLLLSPKGVAVTGWRGSGMRPSSAQQVSTASIKRAVKATADLLSISKFKYPNIYTTEFAFSNGSWSLKSYTHLGEVRPSPKVVPRKEDDPKRLHYTDEGEMVIQEIRGTRQLILTTAATLIAEQNPTNLDNLLFSVGPFAIGGILKIGKVTKLGRIIKANQITWKGFTKGKQLTHFTKHGAEFGAKSSREYLKMARKFAAKTGPGIREKKLGNTLFKYEEATNTLLIANAKGQHFKTFYKPSDGLKGYFEAIQDYIKVLRLKK